MKKLLSPEEQIAVSLGSVSGLLLKHSGEVALATERQGGEITGVQSCELCQMADADRLMEMFADIIQAKDNGMGRQ